MEIDCDYYVIKKNMIMGDYDSNGVWIDMAQQFDFYNRVGIELDETDNGIDDDW